MIGTLDFSPLYETTNEASTIHFYYEFDSGAKKIIGGKKMCENKNQETVEMLKTAHFPYAIFFSNLKNNDKTHYNFSLFYFKPGFDLCSVVGATRE